MFSGVTQLQASDARKTSETRNGMPLGSLAVTRDGRAYRWSRAGGTNLVQANLNVNADANADVVNVQAGESAVAGATTVVVEAGGTIALDAYAGGYLTTVDAAGEGYSYLVIGNTASSGAADITVELSEPLEEALTADTSEVSLEKHPYDGVVISATNQADMPTGVQNTDVTADHYFWNQVWGQAAVLADEAVTRGLEVTIGSAVAGSVEAVDAAAEPLVGIAQNALVDAEHRAIQLKIG